MWAQSLTGSYAQSSELNQRIFRYAHVQVDAGPMARWIYEREALIRPWSWRKVESLRVGLRSWDASLTSP
jgi:hypothetical protein